MSDDLHNRGPSDPDSDPADVWEGLPLALAGDETEEDTPPSGQATVVQIVRPPPSVALARPGRHLAALLLWTGTVALVLSVVAIATAALQGTRPAGWRGPLLTFDAAVILLVLYAVLSSGASAGNVCRRFVGGAGLAIAAAVVLGALLHAVDLFIHGAPAARLIREVSAFGLLGLAGCAVFVECLRDRGWACRAVVAATAAFAPLATLGTGPRFELFAARDVASLYLLRRHLPGLVACGICGAGLVASWLALGAGARRSRLRKPLAAMWLAMLLAAAAFMAFVAVRTLGAATACQRLWTAAALWCLPPLAVVVVAGMASCWGRRGAADADALQATGFAWQLVAAGGLVLLGLGLHARGWTPGLEPLLMAGGLAAALIVAWLATARGPWTGRWALLPIGGAAVAVACALRVLLDLGRNMGVGRTEVWNLGAAYLWCLVVVGLALAFCGALVARQRSRAEHPARALQEDLALLTTSGTILSGACLAVMLALWLGRPEALTGLRAALAGAAGLLRDLVTLGNGRVVWDAAGRLLGAALRAWVLAGAVLAGSAAVLLAHVLARGGVQWALRLVAVLWCAALVPGAAFCVLFASGLFLPLPVAGVTTRAGNVLASYFAARLAVMAVAAGLLARFWQATGSALQSAREPQRAPLPAWPHRPGWASAHLRFLVVCGVVLSAVALGVALLLDMTPRAEGILFEWTGLARNCGAAAIAAGLHMGRAARVGLPCAISVGVMVYALLMVHEETRNARPAVYPVVATLWLSSLAPCVARLVIDAIAMPRPPMPGRIVALTVAVILILALTACAVSLLARWWQLRRGGNLDEPDQAPSGSPSRAAAQGLGTLGLVLTVATSLIVLHGMAAGLAGYGRFAEGLGHSAAGLPGLGALQVARLELFLAERGAVRLGVLCMVAVAAAALALHAVARHQVFLARSAVYSVWFIVALGGLAGAAFVARGHLPGTWSAARIVAFLALMAFVGRTGIALASPGGWLVQRPVGLR